MLRGMQSYDVLVLGGGTAGTAAASAASAAGARVAVFNDGELGGLCILRGCMPTKTMLHAAHLAHEARHSPTPGVSAAGVQIDFAAVMANKDAKVARFKRAKVDSIEAGDYELIDARARFTGPDTLEAGGKSYRFERGAVIACGSVPSAPPIPGLEDVPYWNSDDVMALTEAPASIAVIGSGAIGLELAQFLARMGTQVTLLSRRRVFTDAGPLIADEMEGALRAEPNFELLAPCTPERIARDGDGVALTLPEGRVVRAQALLIATGREPAVDGLGLEAAGVELVGRRLHADRSLRTTNPRVTVAGDATGDRLLLHVANWEGRVAGLNAYDREAQHEVETRLHMTAVFTDPPLATVGVTEAEAQAEGREVVSASVRFPETGRAITQDTQHGACVLVADAHSGELLGAQVLGPRADDIVHTLGAILYYRGSARDMLAMPWYHPTLSEVLLSLARQLDAQVAPTA